MQKPTEYQYGHLTEEFLKALPDKQPSVGEFLVGESECAKRCRQLGAAYGSIAQPAMLEAMQIKYPNEDSIGTDRNPVV